MRFGVIGAGLMLAGLAGCASVEKQDQERSVQQLHRFALDNLRVRRPLATGVDPQAIPGGVDYLAQPVPNAQFDCEPLESMYHELSLPKIRACIASVPPQTVLRYRLRRLPVPVLELLESAPELVPACIKELLAKIPVPREIFFQSDEKGGLSCYSARLDLESDDVPAVGVKWPLTKTWVRIDFPIETGIPETDRKMVLLLASWSLAPFFDEEDSTVTSRYVPERFCIKCLGDKNLIRPGGPPIRLWP